MPANKNQKETATTKKGPENKGNFFVRNIRVVLALVGLVLAAIFVPHHTINLAARLVIKLNTARHFITDPNHKYSASFRAFSEVLTVAAQPIDPATPLDDIRSQFGTMFQVLSPLDINASPEEIDEGNAQGLFLNLTKGDKVYPTVMYIHGGGFVLMRAKYYLGVIAGVGKAAAANVFAVDYRLVPEHTVQDAVDDCVASYKYLIEKRNIPASQIVIMGDSAGGSLSVLLNLKIKELGLAKPLATVLISPAIKWDINKPEDKIQFDIVYSKDLYPILKDRVEKLPVDVLKVSERPASTFASFPPTFIIQGEEEFTNGGNELHEKLQEVKVNSTIETAPGMPHDYVLLHDWFYEAEVGLNHIGQFVKDQWALTQN